MVARIKKKFVVVAYDIQDDDKRNSISKQLEVFGRRVNYSVFECMLTETQLKTLKQKIDKKINPVADRVMYYSLCLDCFNKIEKQPENRKGIEMIKYV